MAAAAGRGVSPLLHLTVLCCFLLPFVTVGASCSEYRTKPVTGVELLSGKDPGIVVEAFEDGGGETVTDAAYAPSEDMDQINSRLDVARGAARAAFLFCAIGLVLVIVRTRRSVAVSMWLGLAAAVAYAMVARSTEDGDLLIGLGLAYLFSWLAVFWDARDLGRLGRSVGLGGAILLVLAVPATLILGLILGGAG